MVITKTGTSTLVGVANGSSFGQLIEVDPIAPALPAEDGSAPALPQPARLTGIQKRPDGIKLTLNGSAGATYEVQRAAALQGSETVWEAIGQITADQAGAAEFTDATATASQGYYRLVSR